MGKQGIYVCSRPLRYLNKIVNLPDGKEQSILVAEEKGIDVRIAIDMIRMAHRQDYDVAMIFSQDQDLAEAAAEIRTIASEQSRWIKVASPYPVSPTSTNKRGVNNTDWIKIDNATYSACLDPTDYRT